MPSSSKVKGGALCGNGATTLGVGDRGAIGDVDAKGVGGIRGEVARALVGDVEREPTAAPPCPATVLLPGK